MPVLGDTSLFTNSSASDLQNGGVGVEVSARRYLSHVCVLRAASTVGSRQSRSGNEGKLKSRRGLFC